MPAEDQELRGSANHGDSELGRSFDEVAKGGGKQFVLFWDFSIGRMQYCWRSHDDTGKTLVLRSSKVVHKRSSTMPRWSRPTTPNPGSCSVVELLGSYPRG